MVILTTAMGQVERGANRIYGVQRDRPSPSKYGRAAVMALVAGLPAMLGFGLLISGSAFGDAVEQVYGLDDDVVTAVALPMGVALLLVAITTMLRRAPRRRQPGRSWLGLGAVVALVLWLEFTGLLVAYVSVSAGFGAVYGPLTGVIALLLWAQLTSVAIFYGLALAAQLEALRAGLPHGAAPTRWEQTITEPPRVPGPAPTPTADHPTPDPRGPDAPTTDPSGDGAPVRAPANTGRPVERLGRVAWAVLGIAGVVALGLLVATRLAVVVVPLLVALFPAALLAPGVGLLHRIRVPRALATALVVVAATAVVGGVFGFVVPAFLAQLPELTVSLTQAGARLDGVLVQVPGLPSNATVGGLIQTAALTFTGGVNAAVFAALNIVFGLGLVLIVLVCYLSGGHRMVDTGLALIPARHRGTARELADRLWGTLGTYIRALSLVALFDASAVALGLVVLGVPLVLPLAVLVFFGAFIPYIGAFLSGLAAVLVAFATGGISAALAVLILVIVVQQVDGNVVQPLVMGRLTRLTAFTVIVAVTAGAAVLGVLGAFLAVPTAACLAQAAAFVRECRNSRPGP